MHQPDADAPIIWRAGRQRLRQPRLTGMGRARTGVHHGALAERQLPSRPVHDMHVAGQPGSERVRSVVDGPWVERVVIAGQEHDRALPVAALELLENSLPPLRVRRRLIEEVARAEDGVDGAAVGQVQNAAHDLEARPGQAQLLVGPERGEAAAQVPVGGVQQRQRHVVVLHACAAPGHSMTNSAVSNRSISGRWKRRWCASSCHRR